MFTERGCLFQDADLDVAERATRLIVALHEPRELYRAGKPRRPSPDEHDVHRHRLRIGGVREDEALARQLRLVTRRDNGQRPGAGSVAHENAFSPVIDWPRMSVCTSCVPSYVYTLSRFAM